LVASADFTKARGIIEMPWVHGILQIQLPLFKALRILVAAKALSHFENRYIKTDSHGQRNAFSETSDDYSARASCPASIQQKSTTSVRVFLPIVGGACRASNNG
jgi:hypothetical protein